MSTPERRNTFPASRRLHGRRAFAAVFDAKLRKNAGPWSVCAKPNGLDHPRLGLSVSRKVGNAVIRNRVKRLIREAFRLGQHDWPGGYDVVVVVRVPPASESLENGASGGGELADYQRLLLAAIRSIHLESQRRTRRQSSP